MRLLVLLTVLFIMSCEERINVSDKMKLRQINYSQKTTENTNGTFFLFMGNYNESTSEEFKIRVFAETNDRYSFYDIPMEKVSISIGKSPYMRVYYKGDENLKRKFTFAVWEIEEVNIVIPEQCFPKEYNEIKIK